MIKNSDLQDGVLSTMVADIPKSYRPIRPITPITHPITGIIVRTVTDTSGAAQTPGADPSGKNGVPLALLSLTAVQSPVIYQAVVYSAVTVSFTIDPSDQNYDHLAIWFTGYHGNVNAQLIASGSVSPLTFIVDATGETVSVFGQTVSSAGNSAPLDFAAHTLVTLTGQIGAPPAPTIAQSVVGTSTGFQFSFNQVVFPAGDVEVIAVYKVYRNTANNPGTASLIQTIVPTPNQVGAIVVSDILMAASGSTYYYWVSAMNTQSFESTLTFAGTSIGSIGSMPFSVTGTFSYASTSTTITWSWTGLKIYRADGNITSIADSNQSIIGLTATTTYWFQPYYDEIAQAIAWVAGGTGSPAYAQSAITLAITQTANLLNHVTLAAGGMSAATTTSGSGGGSGGGGGGGGRGGFV